MSLVRAALSALTHRGVAFANPLALRLPGAGHPWTLNPRS